MIDWVEYDFFRSPAGLSPYSDLLEAEICYDYELLRESSALVAKLVATPDRLVKAASWVASLPYLSRWMLSRWLAESEARQPLIPTACLLASWFPAPWLTGAKSERRQVIELLRKAYAPARPLVMYPYPLSPELEHVLTLTAENKRKMSVIIWNPNEPRHRLLAQFGENLFDMGVTSSRKARSQHSRRANAKAALERLCVYRMAKFPRNERDLLLETTRTLKHGLSDARISRASKAVRKDFQERRYLTIA